MHLGGMGSKKENSQDEDRLCSFSCNHHPAVPEDYRERTSGTDFLPHPVTTRYGV